MPSGRSIGWITCVDQLAAVLEEPVEVRGELLERLDPLELEPLDREQRDQPDERAHAELAASVPSG